jgi:hypothetical protein
MKAHELKRATRLAARLFALRTAIHAMQETEDEISTQLAALLPSAVVVQLDLIKAQKRLINAYIVPAHEVKSHHRVEVILDVPRSAAAGAAPPAATTSDTTADSVSGA